MPERKMKKIPITAAKEIAEKYGYDQVIVLGRRVGENPSPHGEHMTTYGVNKAHCGVAARVGSFLQREIMGWHKKNADSGGVSARNGD